MIISDHDQLVLQRPVLDMEAVYKRGMGRPENGVTRSSMEEEKWCQTRAAFTCHKVLQQCQWKAAYTGCNSAQSCPCTWQGHTKAPFITARLFAQISQKKNILLVTQCFELPTIHEKVPTSGLSRYNETLSTICPLRQGAINS